MISRIISGGTEVPFKDGPVAVGMKMRYEPTLSYVRNSNEGAVYCAKYKGAADSIVWRLTDKGLLYMDAILLNRAPAEVDLMTLSWTPKYSISV